MKKNCECMYVSLLKTTKRFLKSYKSIILRYSHNFFIKLSYDDKKLKTID